MRIGLDLDGVGFPFHELTHYRFQLNGWHNRDTTDLPTMWEVWEHYGLTESVWASAVRLQIRNGLFAQLSVRVGFIDMINNLRARGHTIHIVTHRHGDGAKPDTEYWLEELEVPYDSLSFSEDKTVVETDMFLEDNPKAVEQLRLAGCAAFLLTRPWNESSYAPWRVKDFDDFEEVVDYVDGSLNRIKVSKSAHETLGVEEKWLRLGWGPEPWMHYDKHAQPGSMRYDFDRKSQDTLAIPVVVDENVPIEEFELRLGEKFGIVNPVEPDMTNVAKTTSFVNMTREAEGDVVRKFESGALRDSEAGKVDFEGALSPLVLQRYAEYMLGNNIAPDGSNRSSDNWQKGIPSDSYMRSLMRHTHDVWMNHRGYEAREGVDIEEAICGVLFNAMGYLHELLKDQAENPITQVDVDGDQG